MRVKVQGIKEAVEKLIADDEARNLNAESTKKMREALERLFLSFRTKGDVGS